MASVVALSYRFVEAVNLTDGLDDLRGTHCNRGATFAIFAYISPEDPAAPARLYLQARDCPFSCSALFEPDRFLCYTRTQRSVHGDTGSLALVGALGSVAILLKSEFLLFDSVCSR